MLASFRGFIAADDRPDDHIYNPDRDKKQNQDWQQEENNPDCSVGEEFQGIDQRLDGIAGDTTWLPSTNR